MDKGRGCPGYRACASGMIVKLQQAIRYRPAVLLTVAGRMRKRRVEVYGKWQEARHGAEEPEMGTPLPCLKSGFRIGMPFCTFGSQ